MIIDSRNAVDKIINKIEDGEFITAFPTLKPCQWSFSVFSPDYNETLSWSASVSPGVFLTCYNITINRFEMELTWSEKHRLGEALQKAYYKTLETWKTTRQNIKLNTEI